MKSDERPGRLFIISAPSGTGKSTVINRIMQLRGDLLFSVSATTREPRAGERPGVSYHFLSRDAFIGMIDGGEFLEYAEYVGNFYGTPKAPIYDSLERGRDVILDIDVQGALQIKEKMPRAISIFIIPPSAEELERRLRQRGTDSEEWLMKRLDRAKTEYLELYRYDHVVINDTVDRAAREILKIMEIKE